MKGKGLETPIESLALSVRAFNGLRRLGLTTIGDITIYSMKDLSAVKNFGWKTAHEIANAINSFGCKLRESIPTEQAPTKQAKASPANELSLTDGERLIYNLLIEIKSSLSENSNKPIEHLFTRAQAAKFFGISTRSLDDITKTGLIKGYTIPGLSSIRYKKDELAKCIEPINHISSPKPIK